MLVEVRMIVFGVVGIDLGNASFRDVEDDLHHEPRQRRPGAGQRQ